MSKVPAHILAMLASHPFRPRVGADGVPFVNQIITCPARVGYLEVAKLVTSTKYPTRRPEATATLIFPTVADVAPMVAMTRQVAGLHFGAALQGQVNVPEGMPPVSIAQKMQVPLRSQKQNIGKDGFSEDGAGYFLRSSSDRLPRIVDREMRVIANDSPELYAGMWVMALLKLYAYPKKHPTAYGLETVYGVSTDLVQLQKIGDDERIVSGGNADNAFGVVAHTGAVPGQPMNAAGADGINW